MKTVRQVTILDIIEKQDVETQEELQEHLRQAGYTVTQATVSRDIKELMLVKVPDADGNYHYAYPKEHNMLLTPGRLERTFQDSIIGLRATQCLVVIRTLPGTAQAVAYAVDYMKWPEILGTIAGDDTVFVAVEDQEGVKTLISRFKDRQ